MALRIDLYRDGDASAVAALNARLEAGGVDPAFRMEESARPAWLPPDAGRLPYQEFYLAWDGEEVRGGYALKWQAFRVAGEERIIGFYRAPVSEGLVEKRFAAVGGLLLRDALRREPLQFALGMGHPNRPLPRMLQGLGWKFEPVDFLFRMIRPGRVLRGLRAVRTTAARRLAMDLAAWTGAAAVGARLRQGGVPDEEGTPVDGFRAGEVDRLWREAGPANSLCAVRDAAVLERLYPAADPRFLRVEVREGGTLAGWAVMLDTAMRDDKYFGNLRIGSLIDTLARPGAEFRVAAAATRYLAARGVDLVIANASHVDWRAALRRCGWQNGPTNFFLAVSPKLAEQLGPWEQAGPRIHLLRGDGDGPIHL